MQFHYHHRRRRKRRVVQFPKSHLPPFLREAADNSANCASQTSNTQFEQRLKTAHLTTSQNLSKRQLSTDSTAMANGQQTSSVPSLFTSLPAVRHTLKTVSSVALDDALQDCLPLLRGIQADGELLVEYNSHGVPRLERGKHAAFLHKMLGNLPSGFVAADASRPWMLYWALNGLHLLGEDISGYRER